MPTKILKTTPSDQALIAPDLAFEAASDELDALVERMEAGQLPLEDSILAYQRGVALVAHCEKLLTAANARVQVMRDGTLSDFAATTEDDNA